MLWPEIAIAFAIAFSLAAILLATRYEETLGADEAYLWYGVLRLRQGEIPQRDFRSYEPGRYLWCWLVSLALGPGLVALRFATHAFYGLCLGVALATLRGGVGLTWLEVCLAGLLLAAWAHPMFKLYEPGLLLLGFSASTWLALAPSPLTAVLAGGAVGIALFFGFNFFLYLGGGLVILFLAASGLDGMSLPLNLVGWAVLGGILGALPFAAFLAIPRFFAAFVRRRITAIIERGSTNLPLTAPWPWRPAPLQLQSETRWRQRVYGVLFMALPVIPALVLMAAWTSAGEMSARWMAGVVAAALGLVIWHHAYSRADRAHIAPSMTPVLLMAAIAIPSPLPLMILAAASIAHTWTFNPQVMRRRAPQNYDLLQLGKLRIWLPLSEHRLVQHAAELSRRHLANGGSLLALPSLLSLYPILGRRAPVYDIYSVFPASQAEQESMLASIAKADVRVAFIAEAPLDGREDLRFSNTHPLVWRHLESRMVRVQELPGGVHVFCERANSDPTALAPASPIS